MSEIKRLREAKGWTQSELASASSVSDATISAYERGTRELNPKTLRLIATALGVEIWELYKPGEENDLTILQLIEMAEEKTHKNPRIMRRRN